MEDEKKTSEDVTEEEVSTKEATSEETPKADIKEEAEAREHFFWITVL